jgi:hypothetical protein
MAIELIIDGNHIRDYDSFVREFNRAYLAVFGGVPWDGVPWDGEIADLHELLGTDGEAVGERLSIRWVNSQKSRSELGHEQMAEYWLRSLASIPEAAFSPSSYQLVYGWKQERLNQARAGEGRTLFEYLVWQIRGDEGDEFTELSLE